MTVGRVSLIEGVNSQPATCRNLVTSALFCFVFNSLRAFLSHPVLNANDDVEEKRQTANVHIYI